MNDTDACVFRSPLVADIARVVGAAIADTDNLKTREILFEQSFQTTTNIFGFVIDGDDDRYFHRLSSLLEDKLHALLEDGYIQQAHDDIV